VSVPAQAISAARSASSASCSHASAGLLDPADLSDHIDPLYRAARALCGSQHDAEDLVQETFAQVLKRPRLIRDGNELAYLMRALRNTYASSYRTAAVRPAVRQLFEDDAPPVHDSGVKAREIMEAIARAGAVQGRGDRGRPSWPVLPRGRAFPPHARSDDHDAPSPRAPARRTRTDQRDDVNLLAPAPPAGSSARARGSRISPRR
jgi:hypothetical protein